MARIECLLMTQELRGVRSDGVRSALLYPEIKSPGRDPRISPLSSPPPPLPATSHPLMSDALSRDSFQPVTTATKDKSMKTRKKGLHLEKTKRKRDRDRSACPTMRVHVPHSASGGCTRPSLPGPALCARHQQPLLASPTASRQLSPLMFSRDVPGIHSPLPTVIIPGSWKFNLIFIGMQIPCTVYEPICFSSMFSFSGRWCQAVESFRFLESEGRAGG